MASFHITESPKTIELVPADGVLSATARFSVTNATEEHCIAILTIRSDAAASWFDVEGGSDRSFQPGETRIVKVRVGVQGAAARGEHAFRLRVARENDRDDDWIDSAPVRFRVNGAPPPPPPAPPSPDEPLYEDATRRIDWRFARFEDRTVHVDRIDGINQKTIRTRRRLAIACGLFALLFLAIIFGGIHYGGAGWLVPLALALAALWLWRRKAHVLLASVGGNEIELLKTRDEALVRVVRAALEKAVAGKDPGGENG